MSDEYDRTGWSTVMAQKNAEIERLRIDVELWRRAAIRAANRAVLLQEAILALNIRMVQPHMSGGGHFMGSGALNAEQAEVIRTTTPQGG